MYNLIDSGSKGNAIIYHGGIMVDSGVSYAKVKDFEKDLQIILLTHEHKDHFNIKTIKKLQENRPTLRIGCGEWMLPLLSELRNVDVYEVGKRYDYSAFQLSIIKLYHDVPNCGYRIFKDETKIFHATDTAHLQGISAKDYDLYAVEHNYDEEKAKEAIEIAEEKGEFCHAKGSIETHLSFQQAWEFVNKNRKESSEVLRLHKSQRFY